MRKNRRMEKLKTNTWSYFNAVMQKWWRGTKLDQNVPSKSDGVWSRMYFKLIYTEAQSLNNKNYFEKKIFGGLLIINLKEEWILTK